MVLTHLLSILILMQIISITLFQFVAIAKYVVNCSDDTECLDFQYCPAAKHLVKRRDSDNGIIYCSPDRSYVCCPKDVKEPETISEKKCMEYTRIDNFCPKTPLIKNGTETTPHQFPFMVAVKETLSNGTFEWICGGALISSNYVLTAAHCFDKKTNEKNYSVILGAHKRLDSGIEIKVDITIHSEYQSGNYFADIALLKLHNETNFTENIKPVCLSRTEEHEKHEYYATGWGRVHGTERPNVLLMGPMVTANCSKPGIFQDIFDPKNQICAGPKGNLGDVCTYDSGGPLFTSYANYDNCLSEIFGVVSGGGNCDLKRSTSRYAKVFFFRKWIEEIVWPEEVQKN